MQKQQKYEVYEGGEKGEGGHASLTVTFGRQKEVERYAGTRLKYLSGGKKSNGRAPCLD